MKVGVVSIEGVEIGDTIDTLGGILSRVKVTFLINHSPILFVKRREKELTHSSATLRGKV